MQDRFKFRLFNKLINKFSYFSLPELQVCLNRDFKSGLIFPMDEMIKDNAIYMGKYEEIQQCTGLKDKNDKLIYEGDILTSPGCGNFQVKWANGCYILLGSEVFYKWDTTKQEIIGNIYENPELLEA